MDKLAELYRGASSVEDYARGFVAHMAEVVKRLDVEAVSKAVGVLERACEDDKTIFLIANGGSAAVAGHWVNDLSANSVVEGKPGFRVMSLTDNVSCVTALANDVSFDDIFVVQLKANMRPGDVVMAMSVSGNSENLVRAVEYANAHGAYTIACTGMDGGKLRKLAQLPIHVETTRDEYGPAEDMFSLVMHLATSYLTMKRGRFLRH